MAVRNVPEDVRDYWERFIRSAKDSIDFNFRTWFVGFIEGFDNKAFIRKGFESVHFELKLPIYESKVIEYINENMKPLKIQTNIVLTKKRISLKITEQTSLLKIICIFSGSIFLREYFHRFRFWVAVFRYLFDIHVVFFKKTIQNMPVYRQRWLTQTSWLSGLLDARCFFTKLCYFKSFNKFEVSKFEGKLIIPMRVSREIKLFEALSHIYGGKLKITEYKTKKFYYCIDIIDARELSLYIREHITKSKRSNFIMLFFDLMFRSMNLVADRKLLGVNDHELELKENGIIKDVNYFNFELDQTIFFFSGELREVWQTLFASRAEKRAKDRGGQYAGFLEKKYQHVFQLKPRSFNFKISKSQALIYIYRVLYYFGRFTFIRKGEFRLKNSIEPFYKHSILVVNIVNPLVLFNKLQYVSYFIDKSKTLANTFKNRDINLDLNVETLVEAKRDFYHMLKYYDTVTDCEMI